MGVAKALGNQDFDRLIEQFLTLVTEQFLGLSVDEDDPAILVDNDDRVRGSLQQTSELLLSLLPPSDVAGGGEDSQDVPPVVLVNRCVV